MNTFQTTSVAARMEKLATLTRAAESPLRECPDCLYQDGDSVFLRDSPASREAVTAWSRNFDRLCDEFEVSRKDLP